MKFRPLAVLILLSLLGAGRAMGAGFALFEQGVVALGRGGAAVAGPSNPASVFYNPATLAGVHGTRVGITPSVIFFDDSYAGQDPYPGPGAHGETPTKAFPIPAVYLAHELASGLTSGIGLSAPFGLETDWRDSPNFAGRFLSQRARIEQVLGSAALGWQVNPRVRLGASLGLTSSKVILQRAVTYPIPGQPAAQEVGTATLESGREWGLGGSVGIQFLQTESLRWGALLRAGSAVDFDAAATFQYSAVHTGNAREDSLITSLLPQGQPASTRIRFPAMALVGGEYSLAPRLKMELDLNWTGWSVFDTLAVSFARDTTLSSRTPQNFHDALALRLGLEYQASKDWTLRAGAYYDETPQPAEAMSPLLSDTDRIGFTGGFGWNAGPFRLDGYALVLLFQDRSTGGQSLIHLDGSYKPRAFSAGLGVGFAL